MYFLYGGLFMRSLLYKQAPLKVSYHMFFFSLVSLNNFNVNWQFHIKYQVEQTKSQDSMHVWIGHNSCLGSVCLCRLGLCYQHLCNIKKHGPWWLSNTVSIKRGTGFFLLYTYKELFETFFFSELSFKCLHSEMTKKYVKYFLIIILFGATHGAPKKR